MSMTIDETIANEKDRAEKNRNLADNFEDVHNKQMCMEYVKEHIQIAEWLEELKAFRENKYVYIKRGYIDGYSKAENDYHAQSEKDRQSSYDCGYEVGYGKAIDDFANACKEDIMCKTFGLRQNDVEKIAEQLKEGVSNENS